LFCTTAGIIAAFYLTCHLNYQKSKSTNFKKTLGNFHNFFAGLLTWKSACIRGGPALAISTPVSWFFSVFKPMLRWFPRFKVLLQSSRFIFIKINYHCFKVSHITFSNYALQHYPKSKFSPCFKLQL
jgi:hypothetical protein